MTQQALNTQAQNQQIIEQTLKDKEANLNAREEALAARE